MEKLGETTPAATSNPVPTTPSRFPPPATLDPTSLKSLIIALLFAAVVSWLPHEEDTNGYHVPTVIFKGQTYPFQFFVMFIVFGISTSLSALYSYNWPGLARILRSCSVFFLSCAAGVLLFAAGKGFLLKTSASPR